jgi:ferredoxin, 2Fe-2S
MPKVTFVDCGGRQHQVDVHLGTSLMQAALDNNVPGIDGDCGGQAACGTCHIFVEESWLPKVGERSEIEQTMLSFADGTKDNSRLACQINMSDDLCGLLVRLPATQH